MPLKNVNLPKLIAEFHDEDACREALEELRWPDGPVCPRCESTEATKVKNRPVWSCRSCRHQFSVRVGTVLEDSKLPLWKWFLATYLMVESKKGISSNQLTRTLGVSYKSGWYLTHRIRAAMGYVAQGPLSGIVEVDETFTGGKPRRRTSDAQRYEAMKRGEHIPARRERPIIVGAAERGGEIRLRVVSNRQRGTLHEFIKTEVADNALAIYTDEWGPYVGIADGDTKHETVKHSADEWVRGDVHTNNIEGVWSLFKRSVVGSYHHLSVKHLPAYLDEIEWRYNNRSNPYLFRDTLQALLSADVLRYVQLTANEE